MRQLVGGAIVLGVLSQGRISLLAWSETLLSGDQLIVVANQLKDIQLLDATTIADVAFGKASPEKPKPNLRILAVGYNEGLLALLREWGAQPGEPVCLTLMTGLTPEQNTALESVLPEHVAFQSVPVSLRQAEDLRRLPEASFDRVLLLAENHPDPAVADAETALRYALLLERESRFVVELHQESNAALFNRSHDVITTDQMMNHMLAQVALKPDFKALYQELLSPSGYQLRLFRLEDVWQSRPLPSRATWALLKEELFAMGKLALGIEQAQLLINPPLSQEFALNRLTGLLVLESSGR